MIRIIVTVSTLKATLWALSMLAAHIVKMKDAQYLPGRDAAALSMTTDDAASIKDVQNLSTAKRILC